MVRHTRPKTRQLSSSTFTLLPYVLGLDGDAITAEDIESVRVQAILNGEEVLDEVLGSDLIIHDPPITNDPRICAANGKANLEYQVPSDVFTEVGCGLIRFIINPDSRYAFKIEIDVEIYG